MKTRFLLVIWILALAGVAMAAGDDESLNQARRHFDNGQSFYSSGKFDEAAAEFKKAHQARAFPQFLFNIGACYEKMKSYGEAASYYKQYLAADKEASDRADVEKRIAVLEKEAESIKGSKPPETTPAAVAALGEATTRGLVVIESEPDSANIYLDDKKSKVFAKTPWSGSLEGSHTVFVEREGHKPAQKKISADSKRLTVLVFSMAPEDYLGWLKITSNVPGADIYLDKKEDGVWRRTPWSGQIEPGKHTIWVTRDGYNEFKTELTVVNGQTHAINAELKGSPVGYLQVRGDVDQAAVYVDGKLLCERGPCRKAVPGGPHKVEIRREDYKTFEREVNLQPKTEVTITPRLAEKPSRIDAIIAYTISAAFFGTGIWGGMEAKDLKEENDMMADPDRAKEKIFRYGSYAMYGCGVVALGTAVWYTFRDKGAPSTGSTDIKTLAINPEFSPGYAGLGMNVNF